MPEAPSLTGRAGVGLRDREQFFKLVEEGLQQYFDTCDRYWGGILHLTVGVKVGKVGGIIKSENMLSYEGFTLHRIETILRYVLPRFVSRDSVPYAIAAVIDELRMEGTHPNPPSMGRTQRPMKIEGPSQPPQGEETESNE